MSNSNESMHEGIGPEDSEYLEFRAHQKEREIEIQGQLLSSLKVCLSSEYLTSKFLGQICASYLVHRDFSISLSQCMSNNEDLYELVTRHLYKGRPSKDILYHLSLAEDFVRKKGNLTDYTQSLIEINRATICQKTGHLRDAYLLLHKVLESAHKLPSHQKSEVIGRAQSRLCVVLSDMQVMQGSFHVDEEEINVQQHNLTKIIQLSKFTAEMNDRLWLPVQARNIANWIVHSNYGSKESEKQSEAIEQYAKKVGPDINLQTINLDWLRFLWAIKYHCCSTESQIFFERGLKDAVALENISFVVQSLIFGSWLYDETDFEQDFSWFLLYLAQRLETIFSLVPAREGVIHQAKLLTKKGFTVNSLIQERQFWARKLIIDKAKKMANSFLKKNYFDNLRNFLVPLVDPSPDLSRPLLEPLTFDFLYVSGH